MAEINLLVHGDNLSFLASQPPAIADLVVTDPPFFTGCTRTGAAHAGGAALPAPSFEDHWADLDDYLHFLRPRLSAMRDLLQPYGSLVVHLDFRVVHEIKVELDRIFGRNRFVNEIIWHYTGGGRAKRYFSRKHDTLLWYAKGSKWTFNIDAVREQYKPGSGYARGGIVARSGKHYHPHPGGTPADDVWEIPIINPLSRERCGYPTQKPERLLERIILALSNTGDLVVDPFSGSGTAAVVAARHGRRWMACDCSHEAIETARKRLAREKAGATYRLIEASRECHPPA